ncbi:hypothetical protein QJQ45_004308 [Haematococcus lacustris]|nr:hypothetical protein QJQ45_004308 [Haematococcus lacustris]
MVKKIAIEACIPGVSLKEFFAWIYMDAQGFHRLHKETGQEGAHISDWDNGKRELRFGINVNLPAMFKSMLGFPGSQRFSTQVLITVTSKPQTPPTATVAAAAQAHAGPGVKVVCLLTCSASVPWAIQGAAEAAMAAEARASLDRFLAFCTRLCSEQLTHRISTALAEQPQLQNPAQDLADDRQLGIAEAHRHVAGEAQMALQPGKVAGDGEELEFWDAMEQEQGPTSSTSSSSTSTSSSVDWQGQANQGLLDTVQPLPYQPGSAVAPRPLGPARQAAAAVSSQPLASSGQQVALHLGAPPQPPAAASPSLPDIQMLTIAVQQMQLSGLETARALAELNTTLRSLHQQVEAIRQAVAPGPAALGTSIIAGTSAAGLGGQAGSWPSHANRWDFHVRTEAQASVARAVQQWQELQHRLGTHGPASAAQQEQLSQTQDRPRGSDQLRGRVVLVDEHRTTRVSSAVNGQQPCEEVDHEQPTRRASWKPRQPPQAQCSSQEATQATASEPGPSTPPPAKCSKRTKAEQAAEPAQPIKAEQAAEPKGKAAQAKPAPQPGRWLDRDCNAALNMQHIG